MAKKKRRAARKPTATDDLAQVSVNGKRREKVDSVEHEYINAAVAKEYLLLNANWRKHLNENWVVGLAEAIENGEWRLSNDCIVFNSKGELINGQHRLNAIVLADLKGRGVPLLVARGLDEDRAFDSGLLRTAGQRLATLGYTDTNNLASCGRLIRQYCEHPDGPVRDRMMTEARKLPIEILVDLLGRHPGVQRSVSKSSLAARGIMSGSVLAFVHYMGYKDFPDQADGFVEAMRSGTGVKRGDAPFTLRERLIRHRRISGTAPTRFDQLKMTVKAWNCWLLQQPMAHINPGRSGLVADFVSPEDVARGLASGVVGTKRRYATRTKKAVKTRQRPAKRKVN